MEIKHKGKAYRFITYEGLFNTLKNKSLRFTRTDMFNDPLDCSPQITPIEWKEYSNSIAFTQLAKNRIFENVLKSLYICCFSKGYDENPHSYLMWSHYADSHTQVCFEVDFSKKSSLDLPIIVNYQSDLVKEREKSKNTKEDNKGLYIVSTKSKIWEYENEVRLIVDILKPDLDFNSIHFENEHFLYLNFNPEYITKIIFGASSKLHNELKTIGMFESHNLKPEYEKMVINPVTLELESKEYKI